MNLSDKEKKDLEQALTTAAKTATHSEDGALLEQPKNVLLFHRDTRFHPMEHLDNTLTVAMNNFILTYGRDQVFAALSFHYKLNLTPDKAG